MSQMAGGCAVCHHYTQEDAKHPACKACHAIDAGGDIRKPGLKGAYHRQCIGCHESMKIGKTGCTDCHKAGSTEAGR